MRGLYPAKVTYIVDSRTFDAVVDLGFKLTFLVRFQLKGMPKVPHEFYRDTKRILSDSIHKEKVLIKVEDFTNTALYDVWEADVYKDKNNELTQLNQGIIEKVNELITNSEKE